MPTIAELYRQGRNEELWQMSCGFTGLNLEQFMAVQKRLLLEQLELLNRCPLGEKIMRGAKPRTVEEFREQRNGRESWSDGLKRVNSFF